ncbi:hypothetical protein [Streptomyces sp. NPDC001492]
MAYDEGLAERIRRHLGADPGVAEMGVPRSRRSRAGAAGCPSARHDRPPDARLGGRGPLGGDRGETLGEWIDEGYAFAAGLPAK